MSDEIKLLPCPFCCGEVILEQYYETCDGRGDRDARIKCKCGLQMSLIWSEFTQAKKDFNYTGGYYSQNKEFWKGMHQRLIDKWNTRKPIDRIVERLEKEKFDLEDCRYDVDLNTTIDMAIGIIKDGGIK